MFNLAKTFVLYTVWHHRCADSSSDLPISVTETFSGRKFDVSSLGNTLYFWFCCLGSKAVYDLVKSYSKNQAYCLLKDSCMTVTYHFLFICCSPLQFLLLLPKT